MAVEGDVTSIFTQFHEALTQEQDKREVIRNIVKDLDQNARQMVTILQSVHKPGGLSKVSKIVEDVNSKLSTEVKELHEKLAQSFPASEFYRYHDQWKYATQRLVFVVSFVEFLTSERLLLWQEAAARLYLTTDRTQATDESKSTAQLYLDLEDFLHGLISLSNELSRLAVNSVTAADYQKPLQIASFMNDLDSGFRLLNLKNDSLRKRFDSIKYDMKKVEEVVYDISIRGLSIQTAVSDNIPSADGATNEPSTST